MNKTRPNRFPGLTLSVLLGVFFMVSGQGLFAQCMDEAACNYDPEAGGYCMSTEVVQVHGADAGELAGMTTYRLYIESMM
ncbi:MAG: hypothetical protein L7U25_02890, partial [Candidatus Poseidonia sp.]|nr:hypothetical protein [Poseidonia sp.]